MHHLQSKAKHHDQLFLLLVHFHYLFITVILNYFICKSKVSNQVRLEIQNNCLLYHFEVCRMKTQFFVNEQQEYLACQLIELFLLN